MPHTHALLQLLVRFPKLAAAFAAIGTLGFGALASYSVTEYLRYPSHPERLSVVEAQAKPGPYAWVVLRDGTWQCDEARQVMRAADSTDQAVETYIPISNPAKSGMIIAYDSDRVDCAKLIGQTPMGVIQPLTADEKQRLITKGIPMILPGGASATTELCTYCGPKNSLMGVAVGFALALLSFSVYPLLLTARARYQTGVEISRT